MHFSSPTYSPLFPFDCAAGLGAGRVTSAGADLTATPDAPCGDEALAPTTITTPSQMRTAPPRVTHGPGVRPSTSLSAILSLSNDRLKRSMCPPRTPPGVGSRVA